VPVPGGGFRHEDRDQGFAAEIRPDGTVTFEPMRRSALETSLIPLQRWVDGFIDALLRPPGQRDRPALEAPTPDREDVRSRAAALVHRAPPGAMAAVFSNPVQVAVGSGSDKAKRDFMNRTRPLRDEMTKRFRQRQREEAVAEVSKQVVEIWKNDALPLRLRKQQIFELWDDWEGSKAARARIEKAVRLLAPKGSRQGYTAQELARLNRARVSADVFAPYE
jgi:hypothetical protein